MNGITRLLILTILLNSCFDRNNRYNFPDAITVVTQQVDFDSVLMRYPSRIRVKGSSLYVLDIHPIEFYGHEFAYPSMKFKKSFARMGKGPDELINVNNILIGQSVIYLSTGARQIYDYDGENVKMIAQLPEELGMSNNLTLQNDSVFIVTDRSGQNRLIFANRNGEITRRMGSIPGARDNSVPPTALGQGWHAFVHYNPVNGVMALVTQFGQVLELYDLDKGTYIIKIGTGGEPRFSVKGSTSLPAGIRGYWDVYVGNNHIYAIFSGYEYEKLLKREITEQGGNIIHVFDLQGNPIRQYQIDRFITGFYVDETSGKVVGTDVNNAQLVFFTL